MWYKLVLKMWLLSLFIPTLVLAQEFCVTTSDGLSAALETASNNNENNVVKLARGQYYGPFIYATTNAGSLSVTGGYDSACIASDGSSENTVLSVLSQPGEYIKAFVISAKHIRSSFDISNLTVSGASGFGITVISDSDVSLSNVDVTSNSMGLYFDIGNPLGAGPSLLVKHCNISNNSYTGLRLVSNSNIYSSYGTLKIEDTVISNNTGYGGVNVEQPISNVLIHNSKFFGNNGNSAINIEYGTTVSLTENEFRNNDAKFNYGGALQAWGCKKVCVNGL